MAEDGRTEYKSQYSDSIPKSIVAFSNTDGGVILVGVDDKGNTVGLFDPDSTARRCVQAIRDEVRPDVSSTTSVDVIRLDQKDIVEIVVREGTNKPYYLRDKGMRAEGVYVRRGPSSIQTTESQFNEMVRNVRSVNYESIVSFRQDLTFTYAESMFNDAGIPFDDIHKELLKIKNQDGYTNLGFLLSDQCDFQMKAAVLTDRGRTGFKDRMEISGSVLKQYNDAMSFIRRNSRMSSFISGTERVDRMDYPTEAIRELVLNAIIHRDYGSSGSTLISIYDDCLEIASPGTLIENISESDLVRGVSFLRNSHLAGIFYRLGLVEAYGTGIPRVMAMYDSCAKKPEFVISSAVFRTVLYPMTSADSEVRWITRAELEEELNVSKSTANKIINEKISKGEIVRDGVGRNTRYRVIGNDPSL